ncbi:ethylene-responsive transcription factor ERF017-like [Mangifera indica]|uniref:ethylene-responsive transcription factor ERF017-like n=1 Tax=Mangifera indica TaxID=29780 RepID=UPI001CF9BD35|nr:ethylene-responsive transcription factor ERF017-like [Mangifera indica]
MVKPTSKKPAETTSDSIYKGVRKRKWGKWVSEIRLPNSRQRIWLGSYDTPEKAARAFDAALFCLRGVTAKFNFPDNLPAIEGGRSLTPSQIQAAAAKFANSEPSSTSITQSSEQSVSDLQTEYSSPSISDLNSDGAFDDSFLDFLNTTGSSGYVPDFGVFSQFDDLCGDIFAAPPPTVDYGDQINLDEILVADSFLWNF